MSANHSLIATIGFPFGGLPFDADLQEPVFDVTEMANYIAREENFSWQKQSEFEKSYLDEEDESLDSSIWWM